MLPLFRRPPGCPHMKGLTPFSGHGGHLDLFLLPGSPVTLCFIYTSLAPDTEPSTGSQIVKTRVGAELLCLNWGVHVLLVFLSLY